MLPMPRQYRIYKEARKLMEEVDEAGGMVKAIELGIPKMRIVLKRLFSSLSMIY